MTFWSDNTSGACPEVLAAIAAANAGAVKSYGDDAITARLDARFSAVFETDVAVFPVITGTAANALSMSLLAPPYGAVFCHDQAHLHVDACGAPEFYSGGAKLVAVPVRPGGSTRQPLPPDWPLFRTASFTWSSRPR